MEPFAEESTYYMKRQIRTLNMLKVCSKDTRATSIDVALLSCLYQEIPNINKLSREKQYKLQWCFSIGGEGGRGRGVK